MWRWNFILSLYPCIQNICLHVATSHHTKYRINSFIVSDIFPSKEIHTGTVIKMIWIILKLYMYVPGLQESYSLNIRYLRSCRSLINKVVLNVKYSWCVCRSLYLPHALCRKKHNRRKVIKKKNTEKLHDASLFWKNFYF